MARGSLLLSDLQATQNASTVFKVGIERTFDAVQNTMRAHNNIMRELYADFVEPTTFEAERYGGQAAVQWQPMDQLGVPVPVKITVGATLGYPLTDNGVALQWSEMWAKKKTIRELAANMSAIMDGDRNQIIRDIRQAIYYSANYSFVDYLVRGITLNVKRLANPDGDPLPTGPNGETVDTTIHTHYLGRIGGAVANADIDAGVATLREHSARTDVAVVATQADAAILSALPNFINYQDPRIVFANNVVNANIRRDQGNIGDERLGLFPSNRAELIVKPWAITGYPLVWDRLGDKPVRWRYDEDYGQDMTVIYRDDRQVPLNSLGWRRIYGMGVYNRITCAVLFTGNTTYTDPVIV